MGWLRGDGTWVQRRGLPVHAALVLCCAQAAGGDPGEALAPAVAMDLVHGASLLATDSVVGCALQAAGDALLARAFDILSDRQLTEVLAAAVGWRSGKCTGHPSPRAAQTGQHQDLATATAYAGLLAGCACELGARTAGARDATALPLRDFGRLLGSAMQLTEDLDHIYRTVWTATAVDARTNHCLPRASLPVLAALQSGTQAGAELADLCAAGQPLGASSMKHAAALIEQAGGRAWAQAETTARAWAARVKLILAELDPYAVADLKALLHHVTGRP